MKPALIVMNGYTAVGKTTAASYLEDALNNQYCAVLFKSADIKHELFGGKYQELFGGTPPVEYYDSDNTNPISVMGQKDRIKAITEMCARIGAKLKGSNIVIADSTFVEHEKRKLAYEAAYNAGVDPFILRVICPNREEITRRILERKEYHLNYPNSLPEKEAIDLGTYSVIRNKEIDELRAKPRRSIGLDVLPDERKPSIIIYNSFLNKVKLPIDFKFYDESRYTVLDPELEEIIRETLLSIPSKLNSKPS